MAFSGFLFISWRLFELIILIPPVGMLSWFVHQYVKANLITPDYILVLFIVVVLALAWVFFTTIAYLRARHDAMFVALVDLGFVGALIAGVYYLRGIAGANCTNFKAGTSGGGVFYIDVDSNKQCVMLKASFAFAIIAILSFFVTFLLALLVHHHHRNDDTVVVKREYRHSHRGHSSSRRSRSRGGEYRSDYYDSQVPRRSRSHRSSSRRRQYYV
ncbi:Hypothetical protein R9X50_00511000 [Acrodontium crateriforme]|uniref:MARVEL domain-containing protein n=1 Tax=Acrodontium crateriforme TaxID=150365 RepID=A0AAQ3M5V5_9PEZI|nr:Hypothetical protein R9X50_00511000 [Acrodontium crateriforme]